MPPNQAPVPVPVNVQPPQARTGSSRALNVLLGAAVLVAAVGVAFAVGRTTAPATAATAAGATGQGGGRFFTGGVGPNGSFDPNRGTFPGGNGRGFAFGGAATIQGTVDSITSNSVTLKTAGGNTITVGLSPDTTYHQQAPATAADVSAGDTVILQVSGGFRPGNGNGGATGNGPSASGNPGGGGTANGNGTITLGTASDVTVVP
jgi:hypothetical protein